MLHVIPYGDELSDPITFPSAYKTTFVIVLVPSATAVAVTLVFSGHGATAALIELFVGVVMVTVGGFRTRIVTGPETALEPRMSNASAVRICVPPNTGVQLI